MTAEEAARRLEAAFTVGGTCKGDDPVIVARAFLAQAERHKAEMEEARKALDTLVIVASVDYPNTEWEHDLAIALNDARAFLAKHKGG